MSWQSVLLQEHSYIVCICPLALVGELDLTWKRVIPFSKPRAVLTVVIGRTGDKGARKRTRATYEPVFLCSVASTILLGQGREGASPKLLEQRPCFPIYLFIYFFFRSVFSRATPMAYGGSQARGPIRVAAADLHQPQPKQRGIRAASVNHTTAHGNVGSLAHWARPGIELETSWFLVGFVSAAPWRELRLHSF